ncbi:hypothetical protein E4T42_00476 [Aureobasidium subglaciale]|nr:hypothetical protein E4T42_00476 [Aureobasidium subglaciale]
MAPRDQSPRASDNRRPYSDRRDHTNPRDSRPRRDRSNSRDRAPHSSRGGGGGNSGRGGSNFRSSDRDHRDTRQRSRSPTRSSQPHNTRQRSPPRAPRGGANPRDHRKQNGRQEDVVAPIDPDEDEETAMKRLMGFVGFRSTKNTKVPGNDKLYGVRKDKKTEYRQYMNRVGGFNRPLSPTRM